MPPKPQYFHDLSTSVKLLETQVEIWQEETKQLGSKFESHHAAVEEVRRDVAVIKQQIGDLTKRTEIWDRRQWGFVIILIGALLSLASGLIATLATR